MAVKWIQGDSNDMQLLVTEPDTLPPEPVDLTGAKLWLAAKRSPGDADVDAVVYLTTDAGEGITLEDQTNTATIGRALASMALDALDGLAVPTWLYYAVQVRDAGGRVWEVTQDVAYVARGVVAATS